MMKLQQLLLSLTLVFGMTAVDAADWIYRDLKANTLSTPKCETRDKAEERANKPSFLSQYAKRFCETQGYGWSLNEIKENGNLACNACDSGDQVQCRIEDIVVQCKRLKPGSVGLIPGEG